MTDETLKQDGAVLKAIADLSAKIDSLDTKLDKFADETNVQFEAIRQGIIDNAIRFDRLESQVLLVRSDIFSLKADLKEARREFDLSLEK